MPTESILCTCTHDSHGNFHYLFLIFRRHKRTNISMYLQNVHTACMVPYNICTCTCRVEPVHNGNPRSNYQHGVAGHSFKEGYTMSCITYGACVYLPISMSHFDLRWVGRLLPMVAEMMVGFGSRISNLLSLCSSGCNEWVSS